VYTLWKNSNSERNHLPDEAARVRIGIPVFVRKELIAVFLAGYCANSGVGVFTRVCLRSRQGVYSMLEQQ